MKKIRNFTLWVLSGFLIGVLANESPYVFAIGMGLWYVLFSGIRFVFRKVREEIVG